jgi:hypothetical protein
MNLKYSVFDFTFDANFPLVLGWEEYPIWNKNGLTKTKYVGVKDVLLGKLVIRNSSDPIEEKKKEGNKIM